MGGRAARCMHRIESDAVLACPGKGAHSLWHCSIASHMRRCRALARPLGPAPCLPGPQEGDIEGLVDRARARVDRELELLEALCADGLL